MFTTSLFRIVLLVCLLAGNLWLYAKQEVSIKNISTATKLHNEVNCLEVKFDAVLKYSYNQLLQQGDSSDQYLVDLYLKNDGYIPAAKGYGSFQDKEGYVHTGYKLLLSHDVKYFGSITLYIPLAAIKIADGAQVIKPVFKLTDQKQKALHIDIAGEAFTITFPERINLRMQVREIQVEETDSKNEMWDYFFADTTNALPEVCWSVLLATRKINGSPHSKDSYAYHDSEGKDDVEFAICRNDIFYINVYDFDMLSFSDLIGSMRVDMNNMKQFSGSSFTTKFGRVKKMDFVVTIL